MNERLPGQPGRACLRKLGIGIEKGKARKREGEGEGEEGGTAVQSRVQGRSVLSVVMQAEFETGKGKNLVRTDQNLSGTEFRKQQSRRNLRESTTLNYNRVIPLAARLFFSSSRRR